MKTYDYPSFKYRIPFNLRNIIDSLMTGKHTIIGGFPLYLIGGAETYSDIDVITNNAQEYVDVCKLMDKVARREPAFDSEHAIVYMFKEYKFQIIQPGAKEFSHDDMFQQADMSASAVLMFWDDYKFDEPQPVITAKYPDDINNRVCRVMLNHDWTPQRIETYQKKGYSIQLLLEGMGNL